MKTKKRNRLSRKIILIMAIILLISNFVLCSLSIVITRSGIRQSIQQRMLDIANCAAGSVNGDILKNLSAEDIGTPPYALVHDTLAVFRDNVELEYVYGIRDEGDGRFTFTVDPTIEDPAPFGEQVQYTEALARASQGTAAVDELPYSDAWGEFYSAYSPVFDSSGEVAGIIAADFSVSWFESQLSEQTRKTIVSYTIVLLLTLTLSAVLILVVVRPFMHQQEQLSAEVERRASENEQLFLEAVQSLADATDAKDSYTDGHSRRVADYAREIARRYGYQGKQLDQIYLMGRLHDVGKIGVPDEVINKPSRLTEKEYALIKRHSEIGATILGDIKSMPRLSAGARWHHERYDGSGYPDGLSGTAIPEAARIIAVADAYDAMTSKRSYRESMPQARVRAEIENGKGKQFDPVFADIMLSMIDEDTGYNMRESAALS